VKILGWLHVTLGVVDLLVGLAVFGLLSGVGVLSGGLGTFGALSVMGGFLGTLAIVMALPNFLVGLGLLRDWGGWVLVLAVILGLFNLAKFPWGTAVGLYTFWIAWEVAEGGSA
jgi:hypothetical protein